MGPHGCAIDKDNSDRQDDGGNSISSCQARSRCEALSVNDISTNLIIVPLDLNQSITLNTIANLESLAVASALPAARIQPRPFLLESLGLLLRHVEQRESGDVDSAVPEIIQVQLIHRLPYEM